MIEGGTPGASALAQAAQRRATADKLLTEAAWLEAVASDERAMAAQLAALPPSYAIVHDLRVPGSKGNIDHVVIGPGGAFVVMTRRFDGELSFHDDQLWAGDASLKGDFESARVEAQMLTQSLGTPVVPVIGYFGAGLPETAPSSLAGVLVCAADRVVKVVSRGAHTELTPAKVLDAARRAMPLQNAPGSVARGEPLAPPSLPAGGAGISLAPAPPPPARPSVPPPAVTSGPDDRRRSGRTEHEHIAWKRSVGFVAATIASLCLVAFAAGTLLRVLWADKPDPSQGDASGLTNDAASTTTIFITATTPLPGAPAAPTTAALVDIPPPAVSFVANCPAPGQGWSMVFNWPGDSLGLARYDVEYQKPDGTWVLVGSATKEAPAGGTITAQPPNTNVAVRVTAFLVNGSHGPASTTAIITPATTC